MTKHKNNHKADEPKVKKTINIVPSWTAAGQIYAAAIENGTSKGQQAGREGIHEMGTKLDAANKQFKEMNSEINRLTAIIDDLKTDQMKD